VCGTDRVSGRDVPVSNGQGTGGDTVEDELDSKSSSNLLETGLLCRSTKLVPSCSLFTSTNSCLESNYYYYYSWSTITQQMSFDHLNTNLYRCVLKKVSHQNNPSLPQPRRHITASDEAKQSTSHPHAYYPQGRLQYTLKSKLDGPQNCSGHNGNNNSLLSLPGFKPWNVQPMRWSLNLLC